MNLNIKNTKNNKKQVNMNKKKKKYILVLAIIMLFSIKSFAKEIYDCQKILGDDTPLAKFKIISPAGYEYSNYKFYDSSIYDFDQKPTEIICTKGETIKIEDLSSAYNGRKIEKWDLQIYPPNEEGMLFECNKKDEVEKEIVLDKTGIWNIYLCVKDNKPKENDLENWSVNGNHRWLTKSKFDSNKYFYWYFTQISVCVCDSYEEFEENKENLTGPKEEEKDKDKDKETEKEYTDNSPVTEITGGDILYPVTMTRNSNMKNVITWDYYDADDDDIIDAGFTLKYKGKVIENRNGLKLAKDRKIEIEGNEGEVFNLDVWVKDVTGRYGYDSKALTINKFIPELSVEADRVYLGDYLDIKVDNFKDIFPNKFLNLEYTGYKVTDKNNTIIDEGEGKISNTLYIDKDKYEEGNIYKITQSIRNIDSNLYKSASTNFYVVDILKPELTAKNIFGFYDDTLETDIKIYQKQSPLKGDLKDYECTFDYSNTWYEIYDINNELIYENTGLLEEIALNETYNIESTPSTYKVRQYAKNTASKIGFTDFYITVNVPLETEVVLSIEERDDDITTKKDHIYKNESLMLKTNIRGDSDVYEGYYEIKNKSGEVIDRNNEILNGLLKISLDPGIYEIVQYVKYKDEYVSSKVDFKVMKVANPVITISNNNLKDYTFLDIVEFNTTVKDINKSEEHPNGFILKNTYEICDKIYDGTLKEIKANTLEKRYGIEIIQHSNNIDHKDVKTSEKVKINVVNIAPKINIKKCEINQIEGMKYNIKFEVEDLDGYLEESNYKFLNNNIKVLNASYEKNLSNIHKYNLEVEGDIKGIDTLQIYARDNDKSETYKNIDIKILDSKLGTRIYIVDEDNTDFKTNRYIKFNIEKEKDVKDIICEYEKDLIEINFAGYYEDENLKIVFDTAYEFSMYFKKEGTYTFKTTGKNNDNYGSTYNKVVEIKEDKPPIINLNISGNLFRDKDTKRVKLNIDKEIDKVDDETENIKVLVSRDENFINKDEITDVFIGEINEIGYFYFKGSISDKVRLPNEEHVLYKELKDKIQKGESKIYKIDTYNIKPEVSFDAIDKIKIKRY